MQKWKRSQWHHVASTLRASAIVREVCIFFLLIHNASVRWYLPVSRLMEEHVPEHLCRVDFIWCSTSYDRCVYSLYVLGGLPCVTLCADYLSAITYMWLYCVLFPFSGSFFLPRALHNLDLQAFTSKRAEVTSTVSLRSWINTCSCWPVILVLDFAWCCSCTSLCL